jgi:hypothetical protein
VRKFDLHVLWWPGIGGLGRPTPTLVPCWSLNPCLQGTNVGVGLPQPGIG